MYVVSQKLVKANKQHKCDFCFSKIEPNEVYEKSFIVDGGDAYSWEQCYRCIPIVDIVSKNCYSDEGYNSDDFTEYMRENKIDATEYLANRSKEENPWIKQYLEQHRRKVLTCESNNAQIE